jgi:hypothetical protein
MASDSGTGTTDSIVLITTAGRPVIVTGDRWARDDGGDVHVYHGDETQATVDADAFAAVARDGEVFG